MRRKSDPKRIIKTIEKGNTVITSTPNIPSRQAILSDQPNPESYITRQEDIEIKRAKKAREDLAALPFQIPPHQRPIKKKSWIEKEIKYYQSTDRLLIPFASFSRLVREIAAQMNWSGYRFELCGLLALQEAAEAFLVRMFEDANDCALHARRVTIQKKDIDLRNRIIRG